MVVIGKVKRGEKDGERGRTGMLEVHRKKTMKIRWTIMLRAMGGRAKSLEREIGVQERGTVVLSRMGWLC